RRRPRALLHRRPRPAGTCCCRRRSSDRDCGRSGERAKTRLETIAEGRGEVRVPVVLADEIAGIAADQNAGHGEPPVLAPRFGVFSFAVRAVAVLTDGALERDASARIDRESGAAHERLRQAAIGRELERGALRRDDLARVPADERPLAALTLQ